MFPMTEIAEKNEINRSNPITEGKIGKEMIVFFLPLMLGTVFQLMYNTADSMIVGRFVGKEALSAVSGPSAVLVNVFVGALTSLSSGATVIIGQYFGAGRKADVSKAVHTGIGFAILLGGIMTLTGIPLAGDMLKAMNTPADTLDGSILYLQIYLAGMIPNMIYNMGAGILRAIGDSRRPLLFLIVSSVINIFLDLLFVRAFGLGVFGAALATIICQTLSACMTLGVLITTKECYGLKIAKIRIHFYYLKRILGIGIPSTIHSLTFSASNLLIQTAVNGFGTDTVAAWGVTGKVDSIFWMISNSMGITIATFVAQNYGAGKTDRVKKCVRRGAIFEFSLTIIIEVLLIFCGTRILSLFSDDVHVIELAVFILVFLAFFYFTFAPIEICSSSLRGMGDAVGPMVISVAGVCGLRVLWIVTAFRKAPTLENLMTAYPLSWGISSIVLIIYYLIRSHMKHKAINPNALKDRKRSKAPAMILYFIGILFILYGITVMLARSGSKFFLCWIAGGLFLMVLAFAAQKGLLLRINKPVKIIFISLFSLGVAFVIATQCMVLSAFNSHGRAGLDYIIVLGAQVHPTGPAVVLKYRLDTAYDYAAANPDTVIVVSGGQGSNETRTEADVMKEYLISRGIAEERIITEDRSRNTSENLQFTSAILGEDTGSSIGIVTSNFHVFRAMAIAKKSGYTDIYGISAPSVIQYLPNNMIRESVGILKDFLMHNL